MYAQICGKVLAERIREKEYEGKKKTEYFYDVFDEQTGEVVAVKCTKSEQEIKDKIDETIYLNVDIRPWVMGSRAGITIYFVSLPE